MLTASSKERYFTCSGQRRKTEDKDNTKKDYLKQGRVSDSLHQQIQGMNVLQLKPWFRI